MPRVSKTTYLWHAVRVLVYVFICKFASRKLLRNWRRFKTVCMLVVATVLYKAIDKAIEKMVCWWKNLDPVEAMDELSMYDGNGGLANISAVLTFDKFEYESFSKYLHSKNREIQAMRRVMYSFMGKYYFKKLSKEQYDAMWPTLCSKVEGVHTKSELETFMNELMQKPVELFKKVPCTYLLIPDYTPEESIMIVFGHHCFCDGIQYFAVLQALTSERDFSQLPRVPEPTLKQKIAATFMAPYLAVAQAARILMLPR